jgi:selenide,water dikinase
LQVMLNQLQQLNKVGQELGSFTSVHAMTDVTGFGLLGHLVEMCEGSGTSAELYYQNIPLLALAKEYLAQGAIPGGSKRNWESYGHKVSFSSQLDQQELLGILPDPQTNGGLLIAVDKEKQNEVKTVLEKHSLYSTVIGKLIPTKEKAVFVI